MNAIVLTPRDRRLLYAAVGIYVIHLGYAIISYRSLYADGAYFFVKILEHRSFMIWGASRLLGQAVSQLPVVMTLKLGLTDVRALLYLHGLSLFGFYPLSLLICYWAVKRAPHYLLFPLLGLFSGSLNAEFDIITDSHRLVCFFWPLCLLMLFRKGLTASVLIALLAFPTLASYESMLFLGPILAGIAFWRGIQTRSQRVHQVLWYLLAVWFLAGIGVAIQATIHPEIPSNLWDFLLSMLFFVRRHAVHIPGMLSLGFLGLIMLICFGKPRWREPLPARIVLEGLGLCALVAFLPILAPSTVGLHLQHAARVLNVYLPALLALIVVAIRQRWLSFPPLVWRRIGMLVAVLGITQGIWHLSATYQWTRYLHIFRQELRKTSGVVPFEHTALARLDQPPYQSSYSMNWSWTMPTMSIILARDGLVTTMIKNAVEYQDNWQPFDPKIPAQLPNLRHYDITYSPDLQVRTD